MCPIAYINPRLLYGGARPRKAESRITGSTLRFFHPRSATRLSGVLESPTVERAGEFLGRVAQRLGKPEAAIAWLGAAWPSIVGGALAAHTRPIRCESGCLTIVQWHQPRVGPDAGSRSCIDRIENGAEQRFTRTGQRIHPVHSQTDLAPPCGPAM